VTSSRGSLCELASLVKVSPQRYVYVYKRESVCVCVCECVNIYIYIYIYIYVCIPLCADSSAS